MNRQEMLSEIDEEFERYADGEGSISLEYLRSKVRSVVNTFCDEISLDMKNMSEMIDRAME